MFAVNTVASVIERLATATDICITTTAKTDEEGLALLKLFNFPFKN